MLVAMTSALSQLKLDSPITCKIQMVAVLLSLATAQLVDAIAPTADEMTEARHWVAAHLETAPTRKQPSPHASHLRKDRPPAACHLAVCHPVGDGHLPLAHVAGPEPNGG